MGGPGRGSSRRRRVRSHAPAGSAPASRTTRGCSPPTVSTRRSRASRSASSRRSRTTCAACATCPRSSTTAPAWSRTRWSSEGTNWFGHDSRHVDPATGATVVRLQHRRDGQVPERRRADLALDRRRRVPRRDVRASRSATCATSWTALDDDGDGWPEGTGNVERGGMGVEKLDNSVYLIRGLYDLADMARSKHDGSTYAWASNLARRLHERFEGAWWMPEVPQHADSIDEVPVGGPNDKQQDQHWIGVTPMEAELTLEGEAVPGLTTYDHGNARARRCARPPASAASGPYNLGLFHTGCSGGPNGTGERAIFGLNTAIQAVGEGNYGRLGPGQQQRYTDAEAEPMFGEPYTGGTPDEQPGALPEILPSPDFDDPGPQRREHRALLDLPRDVHAGLGALRDRVAGGPPAARRAARPRSRAARGRPAAAVVVSRSPARASAWAAARSTSRRAAPATRIARRSTRAMRRCDGLSIGHTLPRGSQRAVGRAGRQAARLRASGTPTAASRCGERSSSPPGRHALVRDGRVTGMSRDRCGGGRDRRRRRRSEPAQQGSCHGGPAAVSLRDMALAVRRSTTGAASGSVRDLPYC